MRIPLAKDNAVTVVIPTYNHGHFISDALDSVCAQSHLPARTLILDDGSTDNTADVVRPYLGRLSCVEYVRMPQNRGVIEMLNTGLDMVATEYVVFLAADDMLDATLLDKCIAIMRCNSQAPVCGVLARYVDEMKRSVPTPGLFDFGREPRYMPPGECLRWLYRHGALFGGNGAMYRAEPLRRHGGFASELRSFCDGFRIQEMALSDGVCIVPEVLASWRQRSVTYAAVNRTDPVAALAIAEAVDAHLQRERSPFPPSYADRLRNRLRFAAAVAAIDRVPVDRAALRRALAAYPGAVAGFVTLFLRLAGRHAAKAALAVLLRPFDIPRVLRRRNSLIG